MKALIATMAGDFHAAVVALELERRGHQIIDFYGEDYPRDQTQSFGLTSESSAVTFVCGGSKFDLSDVHVVWNRRKIAFTFPNYIHSDDEKFVRGELRAFADAMWATVAPAAFWINPVEVTASARHKLKQVLVARRVGFAVPDTLVSNCESDIRTFIRMHSDVGTIYKSFRPAWWDRPDEFRSLFATLILESDLPVGETLQSCPGIYQEFVKKVYEIRVTVCGRTAVSIKLNPSSSSKQTVDSRERQLIGVDSEIYILPDRVKDMVFAFMDALDLRFGCFDLVRGEDGLYYFLEVNEAGQFLWIDDLQPSACLLDIFCGFIESGSKTYVHDRKRTGTSLQAWRESGEIENRMRAEIT